MIGNSVIDEVFDAIARQQDMLTAIKFIDLYRAANGGTVDVEHDMDHATPAEQIRSLNNFWRKQVTGVEDGVNIRVWLCEGSDIGSYVHAFEHEWLPILIKMGIL